MNKRWIWFCSMKVHKNDENVMLSAERKERCDFSITLLNEIMRSSEDKAGRRKNERFSNAKTDLKLLGIEVKVYVSMYEFMYECVISRNRSSFLNKHIDCAQSDRERGKWCCECLCVMREARKCKWIDIRYEATRQENGGAGGKNETPKDK